MLLLHITFEPAPEAVTGEKRQNRVQIIGAKMNTSKPHVMHQSMDVAEGE